MADVKRSWDLISKEKRTDSINEIIYHFKQERDEDIGIIAAENLLDFFLQLVAKDIYNVGVEESKNYLKKRFEDIDMDMELLLKKQ